MASADLTQVLIYTNSRRVWRQNTSGDYWILDRQSKSLRKLGGNVPASTLMFAKFSPDGSQVAYVHDNNLYVENVRTGTITQLTHDGSETVINGTSDWVYEEELDIREAFRWSPDGKRIAYWQFNTSTVKNFALIYDTGAPYEVGHANSLPGIRRIPAGEADPVSRTGNSQFLRAYRRGAGGWRRYSLDAGYRRPGEKLHRAHGVGRQP